MAGMERVHEFDLVIVLATLGAFFSSPIALVILNPLWNRISGALFKILRLKIGDKGAGVPLLPSGLSTIERHRVYEAVNRNSPRSFALAMQGMIHTINNRVFEMDSVAWDEIVQCPTPCIFTACNFR